MEYPALNHTPCHPEESDPSLGEGSPTKILALSRDNAAHLGSGVRGNSAPDTKPIFLIY
jgi:hypothetical protein